MAENESTRQCSTEGCKRETVARGLCSSHYHRARKDGTLHSHSRPERVAPDCSVEGCRKPVQARGLCPMHYARLRKHGHVGDAHAIVREKLSAGCVVEGCDGDAITRKSGLCGRHYRAQLTSENPGCSVGGCSRPTAVIKYKLCGMHYSRFKRHGDVGSPGPRRGGTCKANGCSRDLEARGYCSAHYQRHMKGQDMDVPVKVFKAFDQCVVSWCAKPPVAHGHCAMHWQRKRSGLDMDKQPRDYTRYEHDGCFVAGCEKPRSGRGYCSGHLARIERGAPLEAPLEAPWEEQADPEDPDTWPRHVNSDGYVILSTRVGGKSQRISQHRWVVQKNIGRELFPDENVHHINGVRGDNRLENLELWSSSQPSGQRVDEKADWAIEILKRYRPSALA